MTQLAERSGSDTRPIDISSTTPSQAGRVLGWVATFVCLVGFASFTSLHMRDVPLAVLAVPGHAWAIVLATTFYVLAMILNGCAWYVLVREPHAPSRFHVAIVIVLTAQFGKYIPGNIAQFAGRVALAKIHGFDARRAVASTAVESVLAILAAMLVGGAALMSTDWPFRLYLPLQQLNLKYILASVVTLASVALIAVHRPRALKRRLFEPIATLMPSFTAMVVAVGFLIIVNVLVALSLHLVVRHVFDVSDAQFLWVLGSMVVAWIGGFLTPGAPGGLGVRETLLAGMLAPALGAGVAVGTALSFRVVTTLGDGVGFLGGVLGARLLRRTA
jgi:glycosyltransferase 2 family protein